MWLNPQETADLITFTEKILNGKLHFCAVVTVALKITPTNIMNKTKSFERRGYYRSKAMSTPVLSRWVWRIHK